PAPATPPSPVPSRAPRHATKTAAPQPPPCRSPAPEARRRAGPPPSEVISSSDEGDSPSWEKITAVDTKELITSADTAPNPPRKAGRPSRRQGRPIVLPAINLRRRVWLLAGGATIGLVLFLLLIWRLIVLVLRS